MASVCIPPSFTARAAAYLDGRLPVCTVIGFPNGYSLPEVKAAEAAAAVRDGAQGIDMACGDGRVLRILELQAPGARRMAAADYLRGHPIEGIRN